MFTVFKTFSWTALISALGYVFIDSPETVYLLINPSAHQTQMNAYKAVFDELVLHDQIVVQRLVLKTQVFNAFKSKEISIFQAASCFQTIITEGSKFTEVIHPGHESYSPNIRACLGLLLWLDDPAFRGNDFEVVINDFRDIVTTAKNGGYEINLPLPPAKLLADFIY
jgi:hypothetical protein